MEKHSRIYVAGGKTLIGAALLRELERQGYTNRISDFGFRIANLADVNSQSEIANPKSAIAVLPDEELDLTDAARVDAFFAEMAPEYVFLAAGKSGGIQANQKYPAELIRDNLLVECNVIHSSHRYGIKRLLYLASSCSYPKLCSQPMQVEALLSGPLEPTNEAYAIAKIAGIKLCQAYRQQYGADFLCGIPANVFGPGDDFDPESSHVIAALIRKVHDAKVHDREFVEVWGTGAPLRELIFADDLADACILVMREYGGHRLQNCSDGIINLGSGKVLSVREIAERIKEVVGYQGELSFDTSKPDGMPVKLLDTDQLQKMGWRPRVTFQSALSVTYDWFLQINEDQTVSPSPTISSGVSQVSIASIRELSPSLEVPPTA